MTIDLNKAALCVALLMLASTSLCAAEGGPSRPFFAQMVLQGVTYQVETPNDSSINRVTVRALAGEVPFAEESVEGESAGWQVAHADVLAEGGYPQELAHFLRAFREGRVPQESGEDGLAVLEVLYAAYASAAAGSSVALPFRPEGVRYAVDLWLERSAAGSPR